MPVHPSKRVNPVRTESTSSENEDEQLTASEYNQDPPLVDTITASDIENVICEEETLEQVTEEKVTEGNVTEENVIEEKFTQETVNQAKDQMDKAKSTADKPTSGNGQSQDKPDKGDVLHGLKDMQLHYVEKAKAFASVFAKPNPFAKEPETTSNQTQKINPSEPTYIFVVQFNESLGFKNSWELLTQYLDNPSGSAESDETDFGGVLRPGIRGSCEAFGSWCDKPLEATHIGPGRIYLSFYLFFIEFHLNE